MLQNTANDNSDNFLFVTVNQGFLFLTIFSIKISKDRTLLSIFHEVSSIDKWCSYFSGDTGRFHHNTVTHTDLFVSGGYCYMFRV